MLWANRIAELTGYAVLFIAALGIAGATGAFVNDLIRRDKEDLYPEYQWSRDLPHHYSLWDQAQEATPPAEAGEPAQEI